MSREFNIMLMAANSGRRRKSSARFFGQKAAWEMAEIIIKCTI